jgi:hypothetical protein
MRSRILGALLLVFSVGLTASAQNSTQDQIQALKDSLSPDQQESILQGVLGKGNTSGKKTDQKLKTPETVYPTTQESNKKKETFDGRILRQLDEDPELRNEDTVMIELTSLEGTSSFPGLI